MRALGRQRGPGHAAGAVAAGDHIAGDPAAFARVGVRVRHRRRLTVDVVATPRRGRRTGCRRLDVRVLPDQVGDEQRLRIDEVAVAGHLRVAEPVALAADAELALRVRLRLFQQANGQSVALQRADRPFLDEPARGRCSMNGLLSASRTTQSTRALRRTLARASPAGPAPTMTTGTCRPDGGNGVGEESITRSLWRCTVNQPTPRPSRGRPRTPIRAVDRPGPRRKDGAYSEPLSRPSDRSVPGGQPHEVPPVARQYPAEQGVTPAGSRRSSMRSRRLPTSSPTAS